MVNFNQVHIDPKESRILKNQFPLVTTATFREDIKNFLSLKI